MHECQEYSVSLFLVLPRAIVIAQLFVPNVLVGSSLFLSLVRLLHL